MNWGTATAANTPPAACAPGTTRTPTRGGGIGSWGRDARDGSFKDPAAHTDLMGYGDAAWVSDYTYGALHARAAALAGVQPRRPAATPFRFLVLDPVGGPRWEEGQHHGVLAGPGLDLACRGKDGEWLGTVRAAWARTSHGAPELRVPPCPAGAARISGSVAGGSTGFELPLP